MAHTGHEGVVRVLIENSADINAINVYNNNTALIMAIHNGNL